MHFNRLLYIKSYSSYITLKLINIYLAMLKEIDIPFAYKCCTTLFFGVMLHIFLNRKGHSFKADF